jgi:ATP-binding cassette subfamily F protein 3
LNPNEKVGLVGRNGTGKTTLFRIIAGTLEPDNGRLCASLRSAWIHAADDHRRAGRGRSLKSAVSVFAHMEERRESMELLESEIESKSQHSTCISLLERYGHLQTRWEMEGG